MKCDLKCKMRLNYLYNFTLRYLAMLKHLIFSVPKMGAMVSSGVNHCLFWTRVHEYMSTWAQEYLSTHEYLSTWLKKEISIYLRVLQLVLLQIGPQTLGALKYFKKWNQRISWILNVNKIFPESHLRARNLLSLLSAEDLGEVVGDVEFFLNKRNVS